SKELSTRMVELQDAMKTCEMVLLRKRVYSIMTWTYELHEYSVPRLFVVFRQDSLRWDYLNSSSNKFRPYMVC
ncbi:hypothetical protein BGZ65_012108, partial [Modicella reniformis]